MSNIYGQIEVVNKEVRKLSGDLEQLIRLKVADDKVVVSLIAELADQIRTLTRLASDLRPRSSAPSQQSGGESRAGRSGGESR